MSSEKKTLEELMTLAQDGDQNSYSLLLNQCTSILKGYLLNRMSSSSDVDDVLQEILISLHKARHTYEKSRPFKPWLFSIAKFRLYDHLRKVYRKNDNEESYLNEVTHQPDEIVTNPSPDYEELYRAIDSLPDKQKNIIKLMKIEGHTAKEVANKLNMSESAVKVSAHRAYKVIKKKMRNI